MVSLIQVRELICAGDGSGKCSGDLDDQSDPMDIDTDVSVPGLSAAFLNFDNR